MSGIVAMHGVYQIAMRLSLILPLCACAVGLAPLPAQQTSAIDSIEALDRIGEWQAARRLAQTTLRSEPPAAEVCVLRLQLTRSLSRLGLLDRAHDELREFDEGCGTAPPQWAEDVEVLRAVVDLPVLPTTGIDFSAIDHFWMMVDTLSQDRTPSEAQWRALFATAGYRLAIGNVQSIRRDLELAIRPSLRTAFDSLRVARNDQGFRLRHLARAASLRQPLNALRDSLERSPPLREAVRRASAFLPRGATENRDPPFVSLAIFRNDGYASSRGAIVDLLYVHDNGLVPLLSHEYHHVYAGALLEVRMPPFDAAEGQLLFGLTALRTEGIADLVDKSYPHVARSAGLERYARRYNAEYEQTPATLQRLDSLLVAITERPDDMRELGQQARSLFWSNAHANGAYMARTIQETFGVDSLWPGVRSPFAFLRTFSAAVRARGGSPVFSAPAVALLDELERKYDGR